MSFLSEGLVCAVFNALCFFVMYRVFSAQVELLEMRMREWRKEMKDMKKDIRAQIVAVHAEVGVRVEEMRCAGAAGERTTTTRDAKECANR